MREAWVAEQARLLVAQRRQLGDDRRIVGLARLAARDPGAEDLLAQVAPSGELQERLDAGPAQGHEVALLAPLLRGAARGGAHEIRQAGEVALAQRHRVALLVGEHVLAKRRAERREPVADLLQPLLRRRLEPGAGAVEECVVALQHPALLGREAETRRLAVQGVEPGEK